MKKILLFLLVSSCAHSVRPYPANGMLEITAHSFDDVASPPASPVFSRQIAPPAQIVVTVHNGRDSAMSVDLECGTDGHVTQSMRVTVSAHTERDQVFSVPRTGGRVSFFCEMVDFHTLSEGP